MFVIQKNEHFLNLSETNFIRIFNNDEKIFHEIWNGNERLKQLEMVHDGEFCRHNCPQCRISKFNQLLERLENTKSKNFI